MRVNSVSELVNASCTKPRVLWLVFVVHMAWLANLLSCSLWRVVELQNLPLGSEHCSAH